MTWPSPFFLMALTIAVANFILLCILFFKSSRWTGPGLNIRIERLESEEHVIRGNLARVDRDLTAWHRSSLDSNEEVLRELEALRATINDKVSLRRSVEELGIEVDQLREAIKSLPCAVAACKPEKIER